MQSYVFIFNYKVFFIHFVSNKLKTNIIKNKKEETQKVLVALFVCFLVTKRAKNILETLDRVSLFAREVSEKEKTGIPKMKIGYNRVFGYNHRLNFNFAVFILFFVKLGINACFIAVIRFNVSYCRFTSAKINCGVFKGFGIEVIFNYNKWLFLYVVKRAVTKSNV